MAELPIGWLGARGGTPIATWFLRLMASHLRGGTLVVVDDSGTRRFGAGTPEVTMVVHDPAVYWSTLRQGSVGLGRDYADGLWDCDDLTMLTRVLSRGLRPVTAVQDRVGQAVGTSTDWFRRLRPPSRHIDRSNIHSHYDMSNDFFALMLDETMMYSSAVFADPEMNLADAQRAKLDRLCTKLGLGPDDHVVEIGTGWGGFACHAAAHYGCRVTSTTISDAQFRFASKRVVEEGLADRVTVLDRDYRDLTGTYDKLVSIEMIEAVDWRQHDAFFSTCAALLHDQGLMALQAITLDDRSFHRAKNGTDFVTDLIFPGACIPSIEMITRSLRRATPMSRTSAATMPRPSTGGIRTWPSDATRSPPSGSTPGSSACGTSTSATARVRSSSAISATCRW